MESNDSQSKDKTLPKSICRLPFYNYSAPQQHRLTFPNISHIQRVPNPHDWLAVLKCSKCEYLVTDEYHLCEGPGHLTCRDCWKDHRNLVCAFPVFVPKPSTGEGNCKKGGKEIAPCGATLTDQPHAFIENLLSHIELYCPYRREGCMESIPAKQMRVHYLLKCPFRKLEDQVSTSSAEDMPKPKYARQHRFH